MPTFAAIDIGSNSCRLAIAEVRKHQLFTLHEDREVVRLGDSVFETGAISPDAMASTIRALKRFQKAVQEHACDQLRVVATSAMRDARNASAFIAWVKSTTGWDVEVISGLEEGRLIHFGVVNQEPGARGRCLMVDLGGGSCEVTLSDNGRIEEVASLPLGAVRLKQEFLKSDPPTETELQQLHKYVDREVRKAEKRFANANASLVIATSGTAAALAEASTSILEMAESKNGKKGATRTRKAPSLLIADRTAVKELAIRMARVSNAERQQIPGIGPRRSEIIVGGALVYSALMQRLKLKSFRYSPRGLRDGILEQMLADTDMEASAHRAMEQERWRSVLEIAKRYGVSERASHPIRSDALRLYDELLKVHDLSEEYRFWLQSAATLQEVGKFMNHQGHHRHTQYIIAHSEIYGFTPTQRAITSAIARYLGKSRPDSDDRPMRSVPSEEHESVKKAIALLRLAVALNQDQANSDVRFEVQVAPKKVTLHLHPERGHAELEMWSARKEADYFREVFRRELLVEVV